MLGDQPGSRRLAPGRRPRFLMLAIIWFACLAVLRSAPAAEFASAAIPEDALPNSFALNAILERNAAYRKEAAAKLKAYTGRRTYRLWNHRFKQKASVVVEVRYTSEKGLEFKQISAAGSGTLRKKVLGRIMREEQMFFPPEELSNPSFRKQDYQIELAPREKVDGVWCYVLNLTPRRKERLLYKGRVRLDPQDFAIRKTEGTLARNPSFWTRRIVFTYANQKINGIWLPRKLESVTDVFLFGPSEVTIEFSDYKLNPQP